MQEPDETLYWLQLLVEGSIVSSASLTNLKAEAEELIAIFVSSVRTAKHPK